MSHTNTGASPHSSAMEEESSPQLHASAAATIAMEDEPMTATPTLTSATNNNLNDTTAAQEQQQQRTTAAPIPLLRSSAGPTYMPQAAGRARQIMLNEEREAREQQALIEAVQKIEEWRQMELSDQEEMQLYLFNRKREIAEDKKRSLKEKERQAAENKAYEERQAAEILEKRQYTAKVVWDVLGRTRSFEEAVAMLRRIAPESVPVMYEQVSIYQEGLPRPVARSAAAIIMNLVGKGWVAEGEGAGAAAAASSTAAAASTAPTAKPKRKKNFSTELPMPTTEEEDVMMMEEDTDAQTSAAPQMPLQSNQPVARHYAASPRPTPTQPRLTPRPARPTPTPYSTSAMGYLTNQGAQQMPQGLGTFAPASIAFGGSTGTTHTPRHSAAAGANLLTPMPVIRQTTPAEAETALLVSAQLAQAERARRIEAEEQVEKEQAQKLHALMEADKHRQEAHKARQEKHEAAVELLLTKKKLQEMEEAMACGQYNTAARPKVEGAGAAYQPQPVGPSASPYLHTPYSHAPRVAGSTSATVGGRYASGSLPPPQMPMYIGGQQIEYGHQHQQQQYQQQPMQPQWGVNQQLSSPRPSATGASAQPFAENKEVKNDGDRVGVQPYATTSAAPLTPIQKMQRQRIMQNQQMKGQAEYDERVNERERQFPITGRGYAAAATTFNAVPRANELNGCNYMDLWKDGLGPYQLRRECRHERIAKRTPTSCRQTYCECCRPVPGPFLVHLCACDALPEHGGFCYSCFMVATREKPTVPSTKEEMKKYHAPIGVTDVNNSNNGDAEQQCLGWDCKCCRPTVSGHYCGRPATENSFCDSLGCQQQAAEAYAAEVGDAWKSETFAHQG